jgi:hypothetical protein
MMMSANDTMRSNLIIMAVCFCAPKDLNVHSRESIAKFINIASYKLCGRRKSSNSDVMNICHTPYPVGMLVGSYIYSYSTHTIHYTHGACFYVCIYVHRQGDRVTDKQTEAQTLEADVDRGSNPNLDLLMTTRKAAM